MLSYKKAEIIYDGTVYFTKRFFGKYDRTVDQMVRAARSGKQNIAEGSMASATSKETEIKLMNVARASLEELLLITKIFCGQETPIWEKTHRFVNRFRELNRTPNATYETFRKAIENENPEVCANSMACLIRVTTYLLAQLLKTLETAFINEGGLRERMTRARIDKRNATGK